MSTDPSTPAWMLDVAEDVKRFYSQHLIDAMLERDEDVTDTPLWQHRRSQLDSVLKVRLKDEAAPLTPDKYRGTIREALQIAVTAAENDRQAERFEAALAAMDQED